MDPPQACVRMDPPQACVQMDPPQACVRQSASQARVQMATPQARGQSRQHGFTLLEIALVMAIVAILLGLAIPRLPSLGRTDLEASADRLATTMTYLADEASLRGRIYRLTLDLDAEGWTVAALAPFAPMEDGATRPEFHEDADDPMAGAVGLPDGVVFDVVLDRDGTTGAGRHDVFFLPEGLTENLGVRLAEESGATALVTLDASRGSARREDTQEAE
jgi:prepilin-type N-terminal cleavage/methylation domain-containing protein